MRKCTIGSNRIYQLNEYEKVEKTLLKYNSVFYSTYNLVFFEKENKTKFQSMHGTESLHKIIKAKYNLDDYYANSILQNAKGAYKSQQEKIKDIKSNYKEKLKSVNEKLKKTEKDLIKYIDLRNKLTKHRLEIKQGKNNKLKTGFSHISINGNTVEVRYFKDAKLVKDEYTINKFEYEYLNK